MDLVLNILLLILAFLIAVLAIGGDTWNKGAILSQRVTKRGWMAIICLFLSLILGSIKEWRSENSKKRITAERYEFANDLQVTKLTLNNSQKILSSNKAEIELLREMVNRSRMTLESTYKQIEISKSDLSTIKKQQRGLWEGMIASQNLIEQSLSEIKLIDIHIERYSDKFITYGLIKAIEDLQDSLDSLAQSNKEALDDLDSDQQPNESERVVKHREQISQLQKQYDTSQEDLKSANSSLEKAKTELAEAKEKASKYENVNSQLVSLRQDYSSLENELGRIKNQLQDERQRVAITAEQLNQARRELREAKDKASRYENVNSQLVSLRQDYSSLENELGRIKNQLQDERQRVAITAEQLDQARRELRKAERKASKYENENSQLNSQLESLREKKSSLEKELDKTKQQLQDALNNIASNNPPSSSKQSFTLLKFNNKTKNIDLNIAETWQPSNDGKTATITLKRGYTTHNIVPVIQQRLEKGLINSANVKTEAVDDLTLRVTINDITHISGILMGYIQCYLTHIEIFN